MIKKFKDESIIHGQILRHYDEVIAHKASKVNVLELEDMIHIQNKKLDSQHSIEKRLDGMITRIEKMKKDSEMKFDMIDQSISMEIVKAVKKTVQQAMARGKKASNMNNSFEDLVGTPQL